MAALTAALAKKTPFRLEHTGVPAQDRAQRLAQQVASSHEVTKSIVAALMNQAYVALAVDTSMATAAYATLISTTITTVLASGHIAVTLSLSGGQLTSPGVVEWQVLVDGVVKKGGYTPVAAATQWSGAMVTRVAVVAGKHTVALQLRTTGGTVRINAASINEEHANMLVQEAL